MKIFYILTDLECRGRVCRYVDISWSFCHPTVHCTVLSTILNECMSDACMWFSDCLQTAYLKTFVVSDNNQCNAALTGDSLGSPGPGQYPSSWYQIRSFFMNQWAGWLRPDCWGQFNCYTFRPFLLILKILDQSQVSQRVRDAKQD